MAYKNSAETMQEELVEVGRIPYIRGGITMPRTVAEKIVQQDPRMFLVGESIEETLFEESSRMRAEARADLEEAGKKWELAPQSLGERITGRHSIQPILGENERAEMLALLNPESPRNSEIRAVFDKVGNALQAVRKKFVAGKIAKPVAQMRNLILHGNVNS